MNSLRTGVLFSFLLPMFVHAEATVSLKAVAKNGVPIPPSNNLTVSPGDLVTAEIFLSGWSNPPFDDSTGELRTYQFALNAGSVESGSCGSILPVGWSGVRQEAAFIDDDRSDFVFYGNQSICAVDSSTLAIRWGCVQFESVLSGQIAGRCQGGEQKEQPCSTNADCAGGICNESFEHYAGTLKLEVGSDACGAFEFSANLQETFFIGIEQLPVHYFQTIPPLSLTTAQNCAGACCQHGPQPTCDDDVCAEDCTGPSARFGGEGSTCATLDPPCMPETGPEASGPSNCSVDARIPYPPNQLDQPSGFNQMVLTFPYAPGPAEDAPNDFQITQVPASTPPLPPTIASVQAGPGVNDMTLDFSMPIQPNKWTCVRHIVSNTRRCIGFLPGDANGNRKAAPNDILDIIDNLNGVRNPPLQLHQCDIDRRGVCDPKDILAEIDLLNGANGFPAQNGRALPPCPSLP